MREKHLIWLAKNNTEIDDVDVNMVKSAKVRTLDNVFIKCNANNRGHQWAYRVDKVGYFLDYFYYFFTVHL